MLLVKEWMKIYDRTPINSFACDTSKGQEERERVRNECSVNGHL